MDLHIVIYSPLDASGGGRETWINQFLPELIRQSPDTNVAVYYFVQSSEVVLLDVVHAQLKNVHFVPISCKFKQTKNGAVLRLFKYTFCVALQLLRKTTKESKVLAIGSCYDALPVFFAKVFSFGLYKFSTVIWLRSILEYQLRSLRIKKIARIVLIMERFFLKHSSLAISNGWDTQRYYETRGIPSVVVPNAIDLRKFSTAAINTNKPIIVSYIGRLSPEKGIEQYIQSIQNFFLKHPQSQLKFEVAGDGPFSDIVEKHSPTILTYRGRIVNNEIPAYLESIHCGVALTYNDNVNGGGGGVSNGLLELMAAKKIIIAWDIYTFTQVLSPHSAILVEEGNVEGLVHGYEIIEADYEMLFEKIHKSYRKASEMTIENHVEKFLKSIMDLSEKQ